MKNYRLRGQAWVVFADITAATNALRMMQGFPFYEKPLKIAYAKTKSDVVARAVTQSLWPLRTPRKVSASDMVACVDARDHGGGVLGQGSRKRRF